MHRTMRRKKRSLRGARRAALDSNPVHRQGYDDGSREGIKREWGARARLSSGQTRNAAAAPATVSGGRGPTKPLGLSPGKAVQAPTREPGDLPSAVVTCERVGRGAPMKRPAFDGVDPAGGGLQFAVTCHDTARVRPCSRTLFPPNGFAPPCCLACPARARLGPSPRTIPPSAP